MMIKDRAMDTHSVEVRTRGGRLKRFDTSSGQEGEMWRGGGGKTHSRTIPPSDKNTSGTLTTTFRVHHTNVHCSIC